MYPHLKCDQKFLGYALHNVSTLDSVMTKLRPIDELKIFIMENPEILSFWVRSEGGGSSPNDIFLYEGEGGGSESQRWTLWP